MNSELSTAHILNMTYRKGSTLNFTQRTASSFPSTFFFVFQSEIPSPFPGYPQRPGPGRDAGRRVPGGTAAVRQHHAGGGSTSLSTWDVALPLPPPRLRPSHFLPQNHFLEVTPRAAPAVFKFRPSLSLADASLCVCVGSHMKRASCFTTCSHAQRPLNPHANP